MNAYHFDGLTRRARRHMSRRTSLAMLGAAGLAPLAGPAVMAAKKNNSKKKTKQRCNTQLVECSAQVSQCAAQVEQCSAFLENFCPRSIPACLDQIACCPLLGNCDVGAFVACLAAEAV